jgi:hypothetical protein
MLLATSLLACASSDSVAAEAGLEIDAAELYTDPLWPSESDADTLMWMLLTDPNLMLAALAS